MMIRLAISVLVMLFSVGVHAEGLQIQLSKFGSIGPNGLAMDTDGFENFSGDLGLTLHPRFAGPGSTLGSRGIDLGYNVSFIDIDESAEHWLKPIGAATDLLTTHHIYVRKGLPFSIEIGGILTHLQGTDIWAIALELKWAMIEGHKYAPDIGLRTHVNTMLGNRDLVMITSGGDLTISKSFGIGGVLQLIPFAGYELTYVHTRSHVLGLFTEGNLKPTTFILPSQDIVRHRALIGLRFISGLLDFGFEASLGELQSYTLKVGLNL